MIRKEVMIVLVTFCLTATLFSIIPVGSQGIREYDSWYDINDDGKIDLKDYYRVGLKFGTEGDPTKNVNVTNWPEWFGSAKKGINQSLALNLVIPKGDWWWSSSVLVDGYRQFYLLIDLLNPAYAPIEVYLSYKAGCIESQVNNIGPMTDNDWTYLYGPFDVKAPEIRLGLRNVLLLGDITVSVAVYAPP